MIATEPAGRRTMATDMGRLLSPVQDGLGRVEAKMKSVDASIFAPLANAFLELIGSGGKRLRPALALLTAGSSSRPPWRNRSGSGGCAGCRCGDAAHLHPGP